MGILTHALNQDAEILEITTDKHGDQVLGDSEDVKCRFRYVTELDKASNREGLTTADAIVWFEPDVTVQEGSIIKVENKYWRIDRLIKARKLENSTIYFLKAFVKAHAGIDEEEFS